MGYLDNFKEHAELVANNGNLTHDLIAGAAAYEAAKAYENHKAKNGQPDNHAQAKELIAAFAGAATTRLLETEGRAVYDKYKVEHQANKLLHEEITEDNY